MSTNSRARLAILAGMVAALAAFVVILALGLTSGGYRIDEAHKVADTFFFRLSMNGEFHDPAWLRNIVDRTNPPVGKYVFGVAALVSGAPIPRTLAVRVEEPNGELGQRLREPYGQHYLPTLRADRFVSVVATALVALLVAATLTAEHGLVAAAIATAIYLSSFLTLTFAGTAVYDPLLTLLLTATAVPLVVLWRRRSSRASIVALAIVTGLIGAAAFQVRLSGLTAMLVSVVVLGAIWIRSRRWRWFVATLLVVVSTLTVGTVLNPFYWTTPVPVDHVPAELATNDSLPSRIVGRYEVQIRDLHTLLERALQRNGPFTLERKLAFTSEYLFGDWSGVALLFGLLLAGLAALPGGTVHRANLAFLTLWGGTICVALWVWLPLPWPRYLLPLVPPLAILAGFGWGEFVEQIGERIRDSGANRPDGLRDQGRSTTG